MTSVLVVEFDDALRGILRDLLSDASYDVLDEATTVEAGLDYLDHNTQSLVVMVSNVHPDHHLTGEFFAHVTADEQLASRHRYLLLSTSPATIPPELAAHLNQLDAAIVPKPFEAEALLALVAEAAAYLPSNSATVHSHLA